MDVGQPNNTLYIQNLNEKVNLKWLKPQLAKTFSPFGELIAIHAKRSLPLRGQAFLVFRDINSARAALERLQGEKLYGKPMILRFARYKSDIVSQADGTYEIERRRREQDRIERAKKPRMTRRQMMAQMGAGAPPGVMGHPAMPMMAGGFAGAPLPAGEQPNKVLYLTNLPPTTPGSSQETQLVAMLKQYPGFVETRLIPNRPDLAFVEYENEAQATAAKLALDGAQLSAQRISVSFARR